MKSYVCYFADLFGARFLVYECGSVRQLQKYVTSMTYVCNRLKLCFL